MAIFGSLVECAFRPDIRHDGEGWLLRIGCVCLLDLGRSLAGADISSKWGKLLRKLQSEHERRQGLKLQ